MALWFRWHSSHVAPMSMVNTSTKLPNPIKLRSWALGAGTDDIVTRNSDMTAKMAEPINGTTIATINMRRNCKVSRIPSGVFSWTISGPP